MPVKYIGRTTDFSGKTLWEILGNLKNFGVGRIVKRNMFERYKEPSYFRILKVDTLNAEEGKDRKVRAYVEKVFRGRKYPKVVEIESVSYKADYRLVPKNEEKLLIEKVNSLKLTEKVIPSEMPFPPLLRLILEEEMPNQEIKLKRVIKQGPDNFYRLSNENETLNVNLKQT